VWFSVIVVFTYESSTNQYLYVICTSVTPRNGRTSYYLYNPWKHVLLVQYNITSGPYRGVGENYFYNKIKHFDEYSRSIPTTYHECILFTETVYCIIYYIIMVYRTCMWFTRYSHVPYWIRRRPTEFRENIVGPSSIDKQYLVIQYYSTTFCGVGECL